jgi:PAS domain S-box-containing protein
MVENDILNAENAEMLAINEKLVIAAIRQQEYAETAGRAEQRLRDLVHGLDAVICEVDTRSRRPTFLSLRAETFLGYSLDHWHSQSDFLAEIIHPSDRERVTALFPAFMQAGQDYEYEFRALSADTDMIWMRNIVRLVRDADGKVEMLRCVIVDVTAQKQAADAMKHTAQALEAAYTRERTITETLQRSLLFMPPEDSFPGLAVKTIYEAASVEALVGGDFWDTFACDHGNVALVLGDVMGHGLPAAIFTAELKYTLRGFVREHVYPARILTQMNAYLCESHRLHQEGLNEEGDEAPVCLTLAVVNKATGQGLVAAAGMEPPLLVRRDGPMEELKVGGLLLGFQPEAVYEEMPFQLEPGDLILLTTDGVTEARQGKEFLGYDGLMRLAQEAQRLETLEEMGQTILDGAKSFAYGTLKDDACVLLARRQ